MARSFFVQGCLSLDDILDEEYYLVRHGRFDWLGVESMAVGERRSLIRKLNKEIKEMNDKLKALAQNKK